MSDQEDRQAERKQEEEQLGEPMTDEDWTRWEAGPGWNNVEGLK